MTAPVAPPAPDLARAIEEGEKTLATMDGVLLAWGPQPPMSKGATLCYAIDVGTLALRSLLAASRAAMEENATLKTVAFANQNAALDLTKKLDIAEGVLRRFRTYSLDWNEPRVRFDAIALRDAVDAYFGEGAYEHAEALAPAAKEENHDEP